MVLHVADRSSQISHMLKSTSHTTLNVQNIATRHARVNCRAKHVAAIARKLGNNKRSVRRAILLAIKTVKLWWESIKRSLCSRLHILLTQALYAATAVPGSTTKPTASYYRDINNGKHNWCFRGQLEVQAEPLRLRYRQAADNRWDLS